MASSEDRDIYAVKGVNSADTLVLLVPGKLPPVEKTVSLSNVEVPKLARKSGSPANDEPYAWEAREFVRKLLIGKMIKFQHDYSVDRIEREFGKVTLQNGDDLAHLLVSEGLAEIKQGQQKGESVDHLEAAQQHAKGAKKGKYSGDPGSYHVRALLWDPPEDIASLSANLCGQTHKVLVEQVLNGGLLRVLLLPSYQMVSLGLSGIQCPSMRSGGPAGQPEPFAVEARFFTERAILHREVNVLFEGFDNRNANNPYLFGSIVQGDKCFQVELLERGLGQVVSWSIGKTTFAPLLRTAELNAKVKQLNKWRGFEMPAVQEAPELKPPYTGVVVQINSGDTVTVLRDGAVQKCTLASCRANKRDDDEVVDGARSGQGPRVRVIPYRNFAWEAREYLREALIGREVTVEPEYERTLEQTKEVRCHCNIFVAGQNVALGLLEKGYAKAVPGRLEERSRYVEEYKAAEARAAAEDLGMHGKEKGQEVRIMDLVKPNAKKCQQYLAFLQGSSPSGPPRHRGIIEAVLSPCRYKVYVPSQYCAITLALTGLTGPSTGRNGQDAEPYAAEAMAFAKHSYYHRDAEVEVESSDLAGTFYGSLLVGKDNVAVTLLREGFVQTNANADKNRYHMSLKAAQMEATREKKRIWGGGGTGLRSRVSKKKANARGVAFEVVVPPGPQPWEPCVVTEIVDSAHIYVQLLSDKGRQAMGAVRALLAGLDLSKRDTGPVAAGDLVAARFTADDTPYRARVLRVDGARITVNYIDFGNSEQVGRERVWVVPEVARSGESLPPQAQALGLAFLAPLSEDSEYAMEATLCLREFLQHFCDPARPLLARVEYSDGTRRKFASLKGADGDRSAQEQLLRSGLGRIERRWLEGEHAANELWQGTVAHLHRVQERAQAEKINYWQYGVVTSDDDES